MQRNFFLGNFSEENGIKNFRGNFLMKSEEKKFLWAINEKEKSLFGQFFEKKNEKKIVWGKFFDEKRKKKIFEGNFL